MSKAEIAYFANERRRDKIPKELSTMPIIAADVAELRSLKGYSTVNWHAKRLEVLDE